MLEIIKNKQTPKNSELIDFNDENNSLFNEFIDFAISLDQCAGLAANQCEYNGKRIEKRFFVINTDNWKQIIINPEILAYYGKSYRAIEGCLSWPEHVIIASRFDFIKVRYYDINGDSFETTLKHIPAQIFQHEIDHLNGIAEITIKRSEYEKAKAKAAAAEDKIKRGLKDRHQPVQASKKQGRNELCSCGSGLKVKKCNCSK